MSIRDEDEPPDPLLVLRTFGRVALSDFVTVVVLSVLYTFASLSIVTIGPALLALMDTFHASVSYTGTGGGAPRSVAGRASRFFESIWTYLRPGLPYTVVVILLVIEYFLFFQLALVGPGVQSLVLGILGVYAVVIALAVVIRAAHIAVRADEDSRPGFLTATKRSLGSVKSNPPYAVIHFITAATVTVGLTFTITIVSLVLLPGLLVLLELLTYEELDGAGAKAIRFAYLDIQE